MHVYRDGQWAFQQLHNQRLTDYSGWLPLERKPSPRARYAEDDRGRVYLWSPIDPLMSNGTLGYFIWADGDWRRRVVRHTPGFMGKWGGKARDAPAGEGRDTGLGPWCL